MKCQTNNSVDKVVMGAKGCVCYNKAEDEVASCESPYVELAT